MQIDMHYFCTFFVARAAGFAPEDSLIMATAAQFMDDNAGKDTLNFKDGARLDVDVTAHHSLDGANIDPEDQRHVGVSFNFFPGNEKARNTRRNLYTVRIVQ